MARLPGQSDRKFPPSCVPLPLPYPGGQLDSASVRFSTGISLASEQTSCVCTCLSCTLENHHQNIKKLICDMHRPVKNRDGGPIAGVAFNGGGGSRQLGPGDNDPVSATHFPEASNHTTPPSPTHPSTKFSPISSLSFKCGSTRKFRRYSSPIRLQTRFYHLL